MAKGDGDLTLVIDGRVVVRPVFEIAAYALSPKAAGAAGYVGFYEAFRRRFGNALTLYQLNDSAAQKEVRPADLDKVPFWFQDKRSLKAPLLGIRLHAGTDASLCPPMFHFMFQHVFPPHPRGMFRIVLEPDDADDAPAMLKLAKEALSDFPIHWGTAGYTLLWNELDGGDTRLALQWQSRHLARHPGLGKGEFTRTGLWADRGLSTVGWLTMIGNSIIEQAGGRATIEARLADDVVVHDLAHGLLLQAGPKAQLGDRDRPDDVAAYASVARALTETFPDEDTLRGLGVEGMNEDDALAWHRRFLP